MPVTTDIVQSWRVPRQVIRRHLNAGPTEPFAFSLLVAFLILAFVAQWPVMSRAAFLQPDVPLLQRMLAAALALLASIPLWYGIAAISHLVAKALKGQGTYLGARMALFLALLAASPLMLLHGMVAGFLGQGLQTNIVGIVVGCCFLTLWILMLIEAER